MFDLLFFFNGQFNRFIIPRLSLLPFSFFVLSLSISLLLFQTGCGFPLFDEQMKKRPTLTADNFKRDVEKVIHAPRRRFGWTLMRRGPFFFFFSTKRQAPFSYEGPLSPPVPYLICTFILFLPR
ncbi:hypothetical protein EDD21DRAFT_29621 [Dissophora ornata]|nr:hypothetical protein EDD21DRAFT_29621 [Dissophora ornata]